MITSQQMKQLEEQAVENGTKLSELMENAGRQVYTVVKEKYALENKMVVIFAGSGNNAGDGFVAARYFADECPVIILFFGDKEKLSDEALGNYEKVWKYVNIIKIEKKEDLANFKFQKSLKYIFIDALLGMGVRGPVREPISLAIDLFNSMKGTKVAVDLPSGVNPDTGESENCCKADLIVCFHDLKVGLEKFKRKTVVVDIGL